MAFRRGLTGGLELALRALPLRWLNALHRFVTAEVERQGPEWVTAHRRPKRASDTCNRWYPPTAEAPNERVAVVVQGPLVADDDFTLNTARLYRRNLPNALLIISTWAGSSPELLGEFGKLGAAVVLSPLPTPNGISNVNYQAVSSRAGIERARELGAGYAVKTRSDQRLYTPDFDAYLRAVLQTFPSAAPGQRARIGTTSSGTAAYIPYALSDFVVFGTVEDLIAYWDAPHDTRTWTPQPYGEVSIRELLTREAIAEAYFCSHYSRRLGRPVEYTPANWWRDLRECYCVIDTSSLDLYWPKYGRHAEHRHLRYDAVPAIASLSFAGWLGIVVGGRLPPPEFEAVLDLKVGGLIPAEWLEAARGTEDR